MQLTCQKSLSYSHQQIRVTPMQLNPATMKPRNILGTMFIYAELVALSFVVVIPIIYATVPLSLMIVTYAFNPDMSISDIIKVSFELGNKKWFIAFGLMFVSGFLAGIVGFIMCFIGVYVTASFSYLPAYFIYKDVIGFDEENEIKQIEESSTI